MAWLEARKPSAPNDLWTADFKGQFRTRDWGWCYPLTVLDHVSRKCLGLQALDGTDGYGVRPGAHERFHRTLKAETGQPVAGNRIAQQRRFNRFRSIHNHERPHEALGQVPPASQWSASPRAYPELLPNPDYPARYLKRLVSSAGTFFFSRQLTHLSSALAGQWVGLDEIDDGIWPVYLCTEEVARYDERTKQIQR